MFNPYNKKKGKSDLELAQDRRDAEGAELNAMMERARIGRTNDRRVGLNTGGFGTIPTRGARGGVDLETQMRRDTRIAVLSAHGISGRSITGDAAPTPPSQMDIARREQERRGGGGGKKEDDPIKRSDELSILFDPVKGFSKVGGKEGDRKIDEHIWNKLRETITLKQMEKLIGLAPRKKGEHFIITNPEQRKLSAPAVTLLIQKTLPDQRVWGMASAVFGWSAKRESIIKARRELEKEFGMPPHSIPDDKPIKNIKTMENILFGGSQVSEAVMESRAKKGVKNRIYKRQWYVDFHNKIYKQFHKELGFK